MGIFSYRCNTQITVVWPQGAYRLNVLHSLHPRGMSVSSLKNYGYACASIQIVQKISKNFTLELFSLYIDWIDKICSKCKNGWCLKGEKVFHIVTRIRGHAISHTCQFELKVTPECLNQIFIQQNSKCGLCISVISFVTQKSENYIFDLKNSRIDILSDQS